ncbi:MAG TPA: hypothetical protein VJA86_00575 [Candidatus Nanoarchaeia archaeon]|nr:hypothetical protein [Candidatus Nanoarchaeia archaeon]
MLKLLGIIDIAGALLLLLMAIGIRMHFAILLVFAVILALKSAIGLFKDIGSWFDIFAALIFLVSIFALFRIPLVIAAILLLQKGTLSFLS